MDLCVYVSINTKTKTLRPPYSCVCTSVLARTYGDDVKEVVVSKRVQYGRDRLPGDSQPEAFHAPADIHQDDHIFGRGGSLDVPLPVTTVKSYDPVFVRLPLDPLKTQCQHHNLKDERHTGKGLELHNLSRRTNTVTVAERKFSPKGFLLKYLVYYSFLKHLNICFFKTTSATTVKYMFSHLLLGYAVSEKRFMPAP